MTYFNEKGELLPVPQQIDSDWGCESPIVIDVAGNGFSLTSAADGVDFDINCDGLRGRLAWTSAVSDEAWLSLDRDGNGLIETGAELFGNYTAQPVPPFGLEKNGFFALAEYDKTENGGNGDGKISVADTVFLQLRLWQDDNHNGISELVELHSLVEKGVVEIELVHTVSPFRDRHGNEFRYRSMVKFSSGVRIFGNSAWDVFLNTK